MQQVLRLWEGQCLGQNSVDSRVVKWPIAGKWLAEGYVLKLVKRGFGRQVESHSQNSS
jgi:hypothetical protein